MNEKTSVMIPKDLHESVKEHLIKRYGSIPDIDQFADFVIGNIVQLNYENHIEGVTIRKELGPYDSLADVDRKLIKEALNAAAYYCFNTVNLSFSLHSSTSGMYPHWVIRVSPDCTVYTQKKAPMGLGETVDKALESFIKSCKENENDTCTETK